MIANIMRRKTVLAVFMGIILCATTASADLEVYFPKGEGLTSVSDIHVVGRSTDSKPATITINGETTTKRLIPFRADDGEINYMLMSILKLDQGENKIVVRQDDAVYEVEVMKVTSPASIPDWTEELSGFHTSGKEKDLCATCHDFQEIRDCLNCHKDKFVGEWVHWPIKQALCFSCHVEEESYVPIEPLNDTCLICHSDIEEGINSSEIVHAPMLAGFCTICHSPHKSTDPTHLRVAQQVLCAECHGDFFHLESFMQFHPSSGVRTEKMDEDLICTDCHTPHYADTAGLLRIAEENDTDYCADCHDEADPSALLNTLMKKYEQQSESQ